MDAELARQVREHTRYRLDRLGWSEGINAQFPAELVYAPVYKHRAYRGCMHALRQLARISFGASVALFGVAVTVWYAASDDSATMVSASFLAFMLGITLWGMAARMAARVAPAIRASADTSERLQGEAFIVTACRPLPNGFELVLRTYDGSVTTSVRPTELVTVHPSQPMQAVFPDAYYDAGGRRHLNDQAACRLRLPPSVSGRPITIL